MSASRDDIALEFEAPLVHEPRALVERLHLAAVGATCTLALLAAMWRQGDVGMALAASMGLLCLVGLVVSHSIRILLGDFYRQFRYKEKFLLFLAHGLVMLSPWLLGGVASWELSLGALLVFLCVQGMDQVFFGRIYAVALVLVVFVGIARNPGLPPWIVLGWYAALLVSMRLGHVRFRVEALGEGDRLHVGDLMRRTLVPVLVPCATGLVAWWAVATWLTPRAVALPGFKLSQPEFHQPTRTESLMWDAFFSVGAIIAVLVLLNYIDKKLRRRRKTTLPEADAPMGTLERFRIPPSDVSGLRLEVVGGPRERILSAFAQLSTRLEPLGYSRNTMETADDWIDRLVQHYSAIRPMSDRMRRVFNAACYNVEEPTEADATAFVQMAETGIGIVRAELEHRQRETAAAKKIRTK